MFGEPTQVEVHPCHDNLRRKLYFGHGYDMITLYLLVRVVRHWTSHDMFVF